jgi:MAF protein
VTTAPRLVLASASPARRSLLAAAGIDVDVIVSGVNESTVDSTSPDVLCLTLARMKAEAVAARLRADRGVRQPEDNADRNTPQPKDSADRNAQPAEDSADRDAPPAEDSADRDAPPAEDSADRRAQPAEDSADRRAQPAEDSADRDAQPAEDSADRGAQPAEDSKAAGLTLVLGCDSVLGFDGRILGKPVDAADAAARWYAMRGRSGVLYTGHCLIQLDDDKCVEAVATTTVHFADLTDDEIDRYVASGEPLNVAGAFTIDGLGGSFIESIEGDPGTVIGVSLPQLRRMLAELGLRTVDLWRRLPPR